ncbi:MAG: hypothetical protein WAN35_09635 [Terracidiphilus sp.]
MKETWGKVTELFRENPILWLPLICADLSAYSLTWLQGAGTKHIRIWLQTTYSALGGSYYGAPSFGSYILKVSLLTLPLVWSRFILNACFYVTAFVFTAALAQKKLQHQEFSFHAAFNDILASSRRILTFTLKLLGAYLLALIPLALLCVFLVMVILKWSKPTMPYIMLATLPVGICTAWFVTPGGIKLIRPPNSPEVSLNIKLQGRKFAICAEIISVAIGFFLFKERSFLIYSAELHHAFQLWVLDAIISLLIALPYVPLYIALSLLSSESEGGIELSSESGMDEIIA